MKENYVKGYNGVMSNLKVIEKVVQQGDKELSQHFTTNNVQYFHFGFKWVFCLLLREFPLNLSIK